jgi:hypothetical protein
LQDTWYVSTRTLSILTEVPHGFLQYLLANVRTIPLLGYEHFPIPPSIKKKKKKKIHEVNKKPKHITSCNLINSFTKLFAEHYGWYFISSKKV